MSVALIGGMDRLEQQYLNEAAKLGMELSVFSQARNDIYAKLKHSEAVVIFTNKVSHRARNAAISAAKAYDIPIYMHHACGVCTLRECLKCISAVSHAVENKPACI